MSTEKSLSLNPLKKTELNYISILMPKFLIISKSVNGTKQVIPDKHLFNLF